MPKRRRIESDDDMIPHAKRIRNFDGTASSVNPLRYLPDFKESNTATSDEELDEEMKRDGSEMEDLASASSFDNLLYQLANMNVSDNKNPEEQEPVETCPICVARVSLSEFPEHVYACLDGMDAGDRHDFRSQRERDEQMAFAMVEQQPYRYSQDMEWQCPICKKMLSVGMSMNVHANECLDAQETSEASEKSTDPQGDETMMGHPPNVSSQSTRPKSMTREQMSACANALLSNPKGSQEYDSMLEMFDTLGFNEKNIRRVVEEGKGKTIDNDDERMMMDEPSPDSFSNPPQVAFSFGESGFQVPRPVGDVGSGSMLWNGDMEGPTSDSEL